MTKPLPVLLLLLASATCSSGAVIKYQITCDLGKGAAQIRKARLYTVVLTPIAANNSCRVKVADPGGKTVFGYEAPGMQVYVGPGVTADGGPNAVIQADSSPYQLFVISLGEHARLVRTIENAYGFWLRDDCGGKIKIWTVDGAFQGDPDLLDVYHYDLFTPEVVFEMRGDKLVDATPDCKDYFDKERTSLRSQVPDRSLHAFHADRIRNDFRKGQVKGYVLKIAFCYLYTGRKNEAKQFIDQFWPSDDSARIWRSIVKRRSEGVLRNIAAQR
jgi:hypothetical protein